jgi:hypothetical protein
MLLQEVIQSSLGILQHFPQNIKKGESAMNAVFVQSIFRELESYEIDLVSGGMDGGEEIVVYGYPDTYYAGPDYEPSSGNNGGDQGGDSGGGGEGTYSPVGIIASETPGVQVFAHTQKCGTSSGAAVQMANHVMGSGGFSQLSAADGSTWNGTTSGASWSGIEFSAVVVFDWNGNFGAQDGEIWTKDSSGSTFMPQAFLATSVGFWHSHPDRGDADMDVLDAYPSQGDWATLENMYQALKDSWPGYDPSIWLTDPTGVTREFKYSEKSTYMSMNDAALIAAGTSAIANKVRSTSCGS